MERSTRSLLGGRYRLLEVIGRGGMAVVWRGFDDRLRRHVAVKVLAGRHATDRASQLRFERESRHVAGLSHPNLVAVHDFGIDAGSAFLVMEYVEGCSLRQALAGDTQLPVEAAVCVASDALAALDHAHRRGLVHRDVKPGNILITANGVAKVADFGVSKSLGETTDLTSEGAFVGTAVYASPEQLAGATVDARSDLYSLGCVLYQCLTGRPPFSDDDLARVVLQQRFAEPPAVNELQPGVPADVAAAVARALDKDPSSRFATAAEMRAALAPHESADGRSALVDLVARSREDRDPRETATEGDDANHAPTPPQGDARTRHRGRHWRWPAVASAAALVAAIAVVAALATPGGHRHREGSLAKSEMTAGDILGSGQSISSPDGRFTLVMERGGNLVSFEQPRRVPTWESGTDGHPGAYATLQSDGDFVVYPKGQSAPPMGDASSALWFTGTGNHPGAFLALQDDGNLVVYRTTKHSLWETGAIPGNVGPALTSGMSLHPAQYLASPNGKYRLLDDPRRGTLRLYRTSDKRCSVWEKPATSHAASVATMQTDGNVVLQAPGSGGTVEWQSRTAGNPGASLVLENNGSLIVAAANAFPLWRADAGTHGCPSPR